LPASREWQSNASRITGFDRVRYTGKPVYTVRGLKVVKNGVELTFTQPLDRATATDAQNVSGKRWNYARTSNYGSPEFSVADPKKRGRDNLDITATKLSPDGKTLTVEIADLQAGDAADDQVQPQGRRRNGRSAGSDAHGPCDSLTNAGVGERDDESASPNSETLPRLPGCRVNSDIRRSRRSSCGVWRRCCEARRTGFLSRSLWMARCSAGFMDIYRS
jgi:hypothetical protein